MSAKLVIKGSKQEPIELQRGAPIPKEGDIIHAILRGEKTEKTFTVYSVEHTFDFNSAVASRGTIITLKEVKEK